MATHKKISREATLELEAGNAAMVDIGKMPGPTVAKMSRGQLREIAAVPMRPRTPRDAVR